MKTSMLLVRLAALSGVLALTACGGISLIKAGPQSDIYDLTTAPRIASDAPNVKWQLVIDEPVAAPPLDTDRMLLRRTSNVIEYVANSKWSARAPSLVQTQLLLAFERSGHIVGVSRDALGLRRDFDLAGELRAFDTVYSGEAPSAHIILDLKLVRRPFGVIAAVHAFEATEPASANSLAQITSAFDRGLTKVLGDAVSWTLSAGETDWQQRPMLPKPQR